MVNEDALKHEIRAALVDALSLGVELERIDFYAPLFDGSIGLDSVDLVSVIVAVERRFCVEFPDGTDFPADFRCIDAIAHAVSALQTRARAP